MSGGRQGQASSYAFLGAQHQPPAAALAVPITGIDHVQQHEDEDGEMQEEEIRYTKIFGIRPGAAIKGPIGVVTRIGDFARQGRSVWR